MKVQAPRHKESWIMEILLSNRYENCIEILDHSTECFNDLGNGASMFLPLPELPQKMKLVFKMVKIDSK